MEDVPARGGSPCNILETMTRVSSLCNSRWLSAPCVISLCERVPADEAGRSGREPDNGRPCNRIESEFIFSFIPQFLSICDVFQDLQEMQCLSHETDKVYVLMELKFQEGKIEINKYIYREDNC